MDLVPVGKLPGFRFSPLRQMASKNSLGVFEMQTASNSFGVFAATCTMLTALLLGGQNACAFQTAYTSEDTVDQWENHLLESKWVWPDEKTDLPAIVLALKYYPGDHRTFELTMYHDQNPCPGCCECQPWVETWTGTYKTEGRRAENKSSDAKDAVKLLRLRAEQHWYPVNSNPYWWSPGGHPAKVGPWLRDRGLIRPTEMISYIDWVEKKHFKEFFAELVFDAPFMASEAPIAPENVRLFLRSDSVKHIGWWQVGTEYIFTPAKRCD